MTRTKRMTAAVLTLVLLLNFAGCGAKNALFDRVSGAGKFAAESLTIYEEKGSFAAEPKTVRNAKQAEEIFGALKDVTLGEVVKTDDKYTRYIFTFADASGSKMSFTLREDGCVVLGGKTYDALGTDTVFEAAGIDPDEETAESKTETSSEASNAQTEPEMTPEPEVTVTPEPTAEPTPEATYALVDYDGGVFTMQLPQGWQIMTGGEYAGYSIRAWDPNDPDVQIFYYGELGPYFKSAETKAQYQSMSTSNDPLTYLPVLEDPTLAGCLNAMDDYQDAYDGIMPQSFAFAKIQNMTVLSETPITTPLASYAVSEASILASLTSETGAACMGMFEGSILDAGGYEINGVDVTPSRSASNIFGIIAPEGKFETVAPILIQSLTSFTFTDEYIQEAIRQGNMQAENAAEASRRNNEMMERVVNDFCEYIRQ